MGLLLQIYGFSLWSSSAYFCGKIWIGCCGLSNIGAFVYFWIRFKEASQASTLMARSVCRFTLRKDVEDLKWVYYSRSTGSLFGLHLLISAARLVDGRILSSPEIHKEIASFNGKKKWQYAMKPTFGSLLSIEVRELLFDLSAVTEVGFCLYEYFCDSLTQEIDSDDLKNEFGFYEDGLGYKILSCMKR